mgnify:CR=1 FL=1
MTKKILIAGATGFIGSRLVHELLANKFEVVILKRSIEDTTRIKKDLKKLKFFDTDKTDFTTIFNEQKIDFVINLVTNFGRGEANQPSQIAETNIIYGLKLIEASVEGGAECFFNVDSALNPDVNLYSYTKRVFRDIIKKHFKRRIKIFNCRLEHVYGENDDLFKFIPMAVSKLKKNEDLDMTDGKQKLDLIYVGDCVSAFIFLINNADKYKSSFSKFEIGTGKTISLGRFIKKIKEKLNSKSKINFGSVKYRSDEQMYSRADIKTVAGWRPKYDFERGILQLIK